MYSSATASPGLRVRFSVRSLTTTLSARLVPPVALWMMSHCGRSSMEVEAMKPNVESVFGFGREDGGEIAVARARPDQRLARIVHLQERLLPHRTGELAVNVDVFRRRAPADRAVHFGAQAGFGDEPPRRDDGVLRVQRFLAGVLERDLYAQFVFPRLPGCTPWSRSARWRKSSRTPGGRRCSPAIRNSGCPAAARPWDPGARTWRARLRGRRAAARLPVRCGAGDNRSGAPRGGTRPGSTSASDT